MQKTARTMSQLLLTHLIIRSGADDSKLLVSALANMDYNHKKLRFFVEEDVVKVYMTTNKLSDFYSRTFSLKMLDEQDREFFKDYKTVLHYFVTGKVQLDVDTLVSLLENWSELVVEEVMKLFETFELLPFEQDFNWQIINGDRISIESVKNDKFVTIPIAVLDYFLILSEKYKVQQ